MSPARADNAKVPESVFQEILKKAGDAVAKNERKQADFYLARYLGLAARENTGAHGVQDLDELIKKRRLAPKAFIPGDWDKDFIDWFERELYPRWGVEKGRVREKARSFEIGTTAYGDKYFVTVVAYPEMELWYLLENGLGTRRLVLAMGSVSDRPTVFFGKTLKNRAPFQSSPLTLDTKKRSLHYLWKPRFFDLDQDGVPEVWLRYNLAWGNGFSQVLECYRIQNDSELSLFRRFQSDFNGIARAMPDGRVEVGATAGEGYHFVTWKYDKGAFQKDSEEDRPFLLKSALWKEYFLE